MIFVIEFSEGEGYLLTVSIIILCIGIHGVLSIHEGPIYRTVTKLGGSMRLRGTRPDCKITYEAEKKKNQKLAKADLELRKIASMPCESKLLARKALLERSLFVGSQTQLDCNVRATGKTSLHYCRLVIPQNRLYR